MTAACRTAGAATSSGAPIASMLSGDATIVLREGGRRIELVESANPRRITWPPCRAPKSAYNSTPRPPPWLPCATRGARPTHSASTASGCGTTSTRSTATRRGPLRGLHAAVGHGRRHEPRHARRARHVQLVPQPRPARRHGSHDRPSQRRPFRARYRSGLVRARLRRVRLRVRHRARGCAISRAAWCASWSGSTS